MNYIDEQAVLEASSLAYSNKRRNVIRKVEKKYGKLSNLDWDLYQWAMFRCVSWANRILENEGKPTVVEEPPEFRTDHVIELPICFSRDEKASKRTSELMAKHKIFEDYMNLYLQVRELVTGESMNDHKPIVITEEPEEKGAGVLFDDEHMLEVLMPRSDDEDYNTAILNKYFSFKDPLEVIKKLKNNSDKPIVLYLDEEELNNEMECNTIVVDLQGDILIIPKSIDETFEFIKNYRDKQ